MTDLRVMVVDDSAVIRGIITGILTREKGVAIAGTAANGALAVDMYAKEKPDVVLMDIEMPVMDGLTALKKIKEFDSGARVIMCSTLTVDNADITMRAMRIGAIDYIPKPTAISAINQSEDFRERLVRLVTAIKPAIVPRAAARTQPAAGRAGYVAGVAVNDTFTTRPKPPLHWKPQILAIGSSTGGPQALFKFVKELKGVTVPIVITQHMPPTFTATLADHITQQTGVSCVEGRDAMVLEPGKAILAPGGKHMTFKANEAGQTMVRLDDGPPENFCKPAVDVMVRSLIQVYGGRILSVILTGMGSDGMKSVQALIDKGGYCVAQDQASSIVWGMPGAVAGAGLCCAVQPLDGLAAWIFDNTSMMRR